VFFPLAIARFVQYLFLYCPACFFLLSTAIHQELSFGDATLNELQTRPRRVSVGLIGKQTSNEQIQVDFECVPRGAQSKSSQSWEEGAGHFLKLKQYIPRACFGILSIRRRRRRPLVGIRSTLLNRAIKNRLDGQKTQCLILHPLSETGGGVTTRIKFDWLVRLVRFFKSGRFL